MPRYDFECKKCHILYEENVKYDPTDKYKDVKCPQCGSKSKEKQFPLCGYAFGNPVGTDRYTSDAQGHDYRFHHNLPNVIAQRQAAEMASKSGPDVYNPINDIDKDSSWGTVK